MRRWKERRSAWLAFERMLRRELDQWFSTLARFTGFPLLFYSILIDHLRTPSLLTAAVGLLFLKNIVGKGDE